MQQRCKSNQVKVYNTALMDSERSSTVAIKESELRQSTTAGHMSRNRVRTNLRKVCETRNRARCNSAV